MQVPGLANRWMCRRLAALEIEVARAMVGTLVIFGRDMGSLSFEVMR